MAKPIIFVCEFITAGGLSAEDLPVSLMHEGLLMRDSLLKDIAALPQYEVITCHDYRIPPTTLAKKSVLVEPGKFDENFDALLLEADMVWLIAPETGGILLALSQRCKTNAKPLIGCGEHAVKMASYKSLTAEALQAAGIATLPVTPAKKWLEIYEENARLIKPVAWVAKPDDGAGCDSIYFFDRPEALADWLCASNDANNHICQPYQAGMAASFSMLCKNGEAWLLSCNAQHIAHQNRALKLTGITLNAFEDADDSIAALAQKIAQMLPDALGYIGVDIVIDPQTKQIVVIEINPRLTTSYVGLGEATGQNMAALILDCVLLPHFVCPALQKNQVEISFGE